MSEIETETKTERFKNINNEIILAPQSSSISLISQLDQKEQSILNTWTNLNHKPKCIIFDLDYTLWPFIIDHQILPPIRKVIKNNRLNIYDHNNKLICHYEDISLIIRTLKEKCFLNNNNNNNNQFYLCIASRATAREQAMELIEQFGWLPYLDNIQIYSGTKIKHMNTIKTELGLKNFNDILFFDDSKINLNQTDSLGIIGYQVRRHYGLSIPELIKGLKKYDFSFSCKK